MRMHPLPFVPNGEPGTVPTPSSNAVSVGAGMLAQAAAIRDPDVQDLLTDVVKGLRAIRHRLESTPGS